METIESVTIDENSLQPFFILHKASQPTRKNAGKAKRKIDSSPKGGPKSNDGTTEDLDCIELSFQNFHLYWSKVEAIIKDVLRNINADEFDKIDAWIRQSFDIISSCPVSDRTQVTSSYPLLFPAYQCASSKQLFTGLVCTKNVEFVDDILTIEELGQHLRSCGYHVANLTSLDFSLKNGISGCLRKFLQHFLTASIDAADISALASGYCEQGSSKNPIIVIIDGLERCCEYVLSDFIIMLSEWAVKISIIVILGVTNIVDALRDILPSYILQYLCPSKFVLESPIQRMDAVITSVLVKHGAGFSLSHDVATFLKNYFLRQDGTLTSFIRALNMASFQHFIMDGGIDDDEMQDANEVMTFNVQNIDAIDDEEMRDANEQMTLNVQDIDACWFQMKISQTYDQQIDSSGPEVMRIVPRVNEDINEEWISDKTRFFYDEPFLNSILVHMGNMYEKWEKFELAICQYRRTLEIMERKYGSGSSFLVSPMLGMAKPLVLGSNERVTEAIHAYHRVIELLEYRNGSFCEKLAVPLTALGKLLLKEARVSEAKIFFTRILNLYTRLYGEKDGRVGMTKCSLAHAKCATGSVNEAIDLYKEAFWVLKESKFVELDDELMEKIRLDLAELLQVVGRGEEGRVLLEECRLITEKYQGKDHPNYAIHLMNLAASYSQSKNFAEDEYFLRRSLQIMMKTVLPDDQSITILMLHLAVTLYNLNQDEKAENFALKALHIREKAFGPESLPVGEALDCLVSIQTRLGRNDSDILELVKKVLIIQESAFVHDSKDVLEILVKKLNAMRILKNFDLPVSVADLFLSYKILIGSAVTTLENEVEPLHQASITRDRMIVNRLSCGTEVQKSSVSAVEAFDSMMDNQRCNPVNRKESQETACKAVDFVIKDLEWTILGRSSKSATTNSSPSALRTRLFLKRRIIVSIL